MLWRPPSSGTRAAGLKAESGIPSAGHKPYAIVMRGHVTIGSALTSGRGILKWEILPSPRGNVREDTTEGR